MSLDGYIADGNGGVHWLGGEQPITEDHEYQLFLQNVDDIVMGYRTYHQIVTQLSPGKWVYPQQRTHVFTRNHREGETQQICFVHDDPVHYVQWLKSQPGKEIWICGGAQIVERLQDGDAIDRIYLTILPILLGEGIRLFESKRQQKLHLVESRHENGMVTCIYTRR